MQIDSSLSSSLMTLAIVSGVTLTRPSWCRRPKLRAPHLAGRSLAATLPANTVPSAATLPANTVPSAAPLVANWRAGTDADTAADRAELAPRQLHTEYGARQTLTQFRHILLSSQEQSAKWYKWRATLKRSVTLGTNVIYFVRCYQ